MPHSYGASFSGVGFLGPRTLERRTEISAKPAPSAIMIRMESQPCMESCPWLVNDFPSQALMLTHGNRRGRQPRRHYAMPSAVASLACALENAPPNSPARLRRHD